MILIQVGNCFRFWLLTVSAAVEHRLQVDRQHPSMIDDSPELDYHSMHDIPFLPIKSELIVYLPRG